MLPKNNRISRKLFPSILKNSKVFGNDVFLLRFIYSNEKQNQFCFSVSKKISKSAVKRNKLRRMGYRLISKYFMDMEKKIKAIFYFRKVVKNEEEAFLGLESVLQQSKLIK